MPLYACLQAWDYNKGTQALSPRAHPEVALAVFHDPNPKPDSYVVRHEGITLQLVKADKGSVHQVRPATEKDPILLSHSPPRATFLVSMA